jgi:hypothetical protein
MMEYIGFGLGFICGFIFFPALIAIVAISRAWRI